MKSNIHPEWHSNAVVVCACGNTWETGATVAQIRTDICSACHPFYTGEQRLVDTEGRVDIFMRRLRRRDEMRAEDEARAAAATPLDRPIADLELGKRYQNILEENGILEVQHLLAKLTEGEEALLSISGIGRKAVADMRKALRTLGYELPEPTA
jgi:large subunit ribosomal protein L31